MSTESYGDADRAFRRALVASALAYAVCHHLGLLPSGLGSAPSETQWADWLAHLWDEVVGHYIWFAGVALVLAALALAMLGRASASPIGYVLAVAVGLTWATNAIGGGTVVFSLVVALVAVASGWRRRAELAGVLWVGFTPAVVVLVGELLVS